MLETKCVDDKIEMLDVGVDRFHNLRRSRVRSKVDGPGGLNWTVQTTESGRS